ncbi:MAG: Ig-like domain-containing protein, partial [Leptospiraceae bacterium]|nr:Ig-like domain-containing protein [Leptospiraceae bacterium]
MTQSPPTTKTYNSSQTPVDPIPLEVNEPVVLLNSLGDDSPKAQFNFSPNSVDRYRNLSITFSHPMNPNTLIEGTTFQFIRLSTSTPITGSSFIWDSPVNLVIDPPQELAPGEQYNIQMTSGVKTVDNRDLTPFNGIFTTESSFTMTHAINGIPLYPVGNNGLILDKTIHPTLTLASTITFPENIASLKLCKLGFLASSPYVVCKPAVASGIEVCSNPPNGSVPACSASFSVNITSLANEGGNHFFYQIETPNGKKIIRSLNFNYGNIATAAQGASVIKKTANLINGGSTIVVSSASGIVVGMIVSGNGIPLDAQVVSISGTNITLSANATTTASGVNVSFSPARLTNASRLFLDKQTGSNESKSTVRALENLVKSYARGDFTLDNKTLNQFINSSTSNTAPTVDASGNSCLAWNRTKKGSTTSGSNIVSVENTTGLIIGMPVGGSGIPSGTTVTSLTSNTVTLSNNATATASNVSLNFNFTSAYGITYLNKIGPFCGITVNGAIFESSYYPNVNYTATADIYVTEVEILETANPGNVDNVTLNLNPREGYLDLVLYGKKARGKLAVVARVVSIEFFDYLVGDTFIFYGSALSG